MQYSLVSQSRSAAAGTPGNYLPDIRNDFPGVKFTATKTDRMGWGKNVNKGILHQKSDFIFLCEDDYVARKDIKIDAGIALLQANTQLGIIRYDGISGHIGINLWVKQSQTRLGMLDYLQINRGQSTTEYRIMLSVRLPVYPPYVVLVTGASHQTTTATL